MFNFSPKKSKKIIAFDIGTFSIKYIEAIKSHQGLIVHGAGSIRLQGKSSEHIFEALKSFFQGYAAKIKKDLSVRIALSGPSVIIRRLFFPPLTKDELKSALAFEAEKYIPFSIDECVMDFQMLDADPEKKAINVLLAAVNKDMIQDRMKLFDNFGVTPDIIDVDIFCLVNAFEALNAAEAPSSYALLNIGHETSLFTVVENKYPVFMREIACGGKNVLEGLIETKSLPGAEEALELQQAAPTGNSAEDEWLKSETLKGFDFLIRELGNSLDYHHNQSGKKIESIFLSGGGARLRGAQKILADEFGCKLILWNALEKIKFLKSSDKEFLEQHAIEFNIALGLSVRSA